jgi:acyl-CoA synthetase (NDP forming)
MDKFIENSKKRAYKNIAKKVGMPFEMLIALIKPASIMFKEALDNFNDNELREFIELYIEQTKISKDFFEN